LPNNPYLDMENRRTAGEAPEGAANNQYLSLADRLESAAVIRQQTTINKALMSNPEIEAEKRRLAGQLNLPAVAIDGLGMDEAKRRSALQQVQQNAANAPVLGRSLARDNFARLAIDDTSPLARIETALKDPVFRQGRAILEAQQRAIGGTLDAFRALQRPGALLKSLLAGTADLAAAAPGVARAGLEVAESYSRSAMPLIFSEKLTPEQIAQIRGERISAEKPFDPNAPLAVAAETARAGQEALRATGTRLMPTARTKGEEMVFGGVRSAGSSLGALLAGALTRSPGLAMEIMGSTAGAESYARGREKGLEPIEAAVYGWTSRNIEKVTELIPVKGLIDNLDAKTPLGTMLLDQLAREIPTEQAATVLGDLNDWVMTNPEGTLQEYLAERPSRALETLVSTVVATGLQTTIVKGADMARESLIQRVQQEKEVNQITTEGQLAVVEALMGEAANSKLAARDRDELQAFVDEAAADSPVTSIYIAPETLAQTAMDLNLDVRVVAEQLGVADQLMSSAQTGADIQLSVGAFIAKVSGTDLAAPLMNVIKTDPFLYSRAEMAQLKETGYANEVAEAEELVRTVLTDESFRASADVVRSQVTEQLQAMGRFTGDINTVYASATAQAYLTLAKRLNITPEEALARAPLKIRGQTITGQTPGVLQQPEVTLEQAQTQGYAGQDIGEAQEWVRAREKGLDMSQEGRLQRAQEMGFNTERVLYHGTTADVKEFRPSKDGTQGEGVYLTEDADFASRYAYEFTGNGGNVIPVYVRGPLVSKQEWSDLFDEMSGQLPEGATTADIDAAVFAILKSRGFTGIKSDTRGGAKSVISVFDPSNIRSVNAAFDPEESASANILAQEARSTLETNPAAFGLTPEQIKKVNPIYNPKTLPVERLPSNQEAALWLESNFVGNPVKDLTAELTDEQIKEIATIMAAEAQLALGNTGNAFTWYSSALAKALDIISIKYPMLADDAAAAEAGLGTSRNARFAFTYIMAVTSQNLDVAANSVATDKAFGDMLKRVANGNFTMPRSWGTGDKQKAMGENFAKFGPLIDKMPGDDFPSKLAALDDLFRVKMTVKEWVAYMKQQGVPYNKPGQTAMDAVVYGSSLLGPKIGNGFWQNLNGNYDPMTIDLWMRRTWGRLTGKSIGNPAALPEQRARLAGAIKRSRSREQGKPDHIAAMAAKIAATEKQLNGLKQADFASKKEFTAEEKRLKAEIKDNQEALADLANLKAPETWSAEYNTSNDALLAYAKRLLKAWNVEYERLKEGSKSGTVPAEAQPTWARAAKTIITNLAKPLDQVANGTQRKQIERAGKEALRILQERGITLTTADLQAILWYPEKELWGSLTAELETDEDGDPVVPPSSLNESYDTAFSRILKEQGYEIQGIAGDGGGGLGAGAVARQDGGPQQPASSGRVGAPGGAIAERGPDTLGQAKRNLDALGFYSAVQEAAKLIPDNVWKMGWPAARSALAKGGAGIAPRKTELQYLNLDAMFGDTKLRGQALKEAVEEHIAANRLSLVENFARFDPNNIPVPTKRVMLQELENNALAYAIGLQLRPMGEGRVSIETNIGEVNSNLYLQRTTEALARPRYYDLIRYYDGGRREVIASGVERDLRGQIARLIVDENFIKAERKISAAALADEWRASFDNKLVRGAGDIRLPGEDVPLFEAVIGIPEGVPGADYQAPISHVGGKAKGTLVTAHGEERIDDKGQRTIFVGQVQSDMAQGKREEKKDLEASAKALRVLENNPNANLFLYTGGQIRVASAEDAADVPYAATLLSRDQVKEMYKTEGARIETPLITTSEWTNVAVRAMIYRAAREGFESISFPTGETSAIIQGNDAAAQHYETNVKGALEKLAKQLGEEVRKGGVATNLDDVAEVNARAEEERLIQQTAENMGIPEEEFANFRKELIEEGQFYDRALSEERAKAQMASAYILDLTPAMREKIMSEGFPLFQERRGEYAPALNEIRINAQADLSTYIHELGHHFLEVYNNVALELVASQVGGQDLAEQEQVLVDDTRRLITEIARQTNTPIDGDALTWWNGLTFQQRVPMHEQFARLTEAYFMTGEAPTPELKDIFSTIRRWMLQVYKSLTELNVELSDEVKEVMGRMYAAQDDIATAERNRGLNRLFSVKPDYMSDQEWQAYQQIAAQATSDAEDELSARSVRDVQWLASARSRELRKLQRANADKRNLMKAEVSLEVMQMPVNRARSFLKRGVGPNDEPVTGPHKLSIAIMESRYPQQADTDPARRWKRLGYGQYGMLAETGLDPDTVAELTGFPSGDALVEALLTAERASTVIDAETDRRMLERYGDLSDEQKMSQAADEAVHNGLRARVLQAEYAALSKAAKRTRPLVMAAKEIAQAQVAKMQASKLNANKFIAAERAAGKKAEAALRKSDLTGAATAKRDQLLNFEIAREIQRVIKQRDRMLTLFKTIVTAKRDTVSKTRNYDLVQASRAVLSAYGFGRVKNDVNSYLEAIKVYDPTLYSNLAPTITNAVSRGMTMDQLSVEQFLGMGDVVKQLWDLSREEMVVEIDGRKLELAAVTQELGLKLESLGAAPKGASTEAASDWQKTLRQGEGLKSSLRRVEAWARLYDGTKVGPFTKYIWRTISTAADRYRADRNKYVQQFRDLFATIEGGMGGKKINAPEINYTFRTKSELLHAILHTGNGSNKRKLLLGRQWGEVDQDGALIDNRWQNLINRLAQEGVLTKADFDFAQGVWDLLEETKPLAQETHRKVFGLYFSEITAEEVQTPFGTYRGGYVPAVYDSYNVQDAALRAQQEQVEANDSTMFPAPASGFTKNRVEYNRELALDLMILPNHIDKVLKFSHMASPVRDVMKILKNKEFSALLEAIDPTAQSDVLLPWLTRAARQIVEEPTKGQGGPMVDGFFRAIRQRSGMGLMFANLVNVAQQVTGFSLAAIVVKPSYLARGLLRYTSNPQKITETIRQASMMMRERGDNQLSAMYGEIDKIIDKDDKYGQVKDWFGRHTYFMQQGVQNVMDVIVWLGAYDQALAAGETENEAAKQGDAAVRMTQGSTLPEDVSRIETGPAVLRSFTHMYSYFNMWGNLLSAEFRTTWRELGLKQGAGRLMFAYMAGLAIPTFFAQIIADGLRGKLPEDEDEDGWMDEWLSWAFMTSSKTALAFIPVAGQAGVATIGAFTNEPYDDRVGGSPAISAVEASVRTPASVYKAIAEDGDKSRAVKDTLTLLTTLTGLPFQVLGRPVGYAVDVAEGDITPTSGADYVRGLVTGAASEASR